jgi:hypothetical protein
METKARNEARKYASNGVASLAHALNTCGETDAYYRYGNAEQARFKALVVEIIEIVETGKIELAPNAKARLDKDFQCFMREFITP